MKKLICLLLVALHLVNLVGGYWIFYALQQQTKAALAEKLDGDHYAGSQAILIKLPLADAVSDKENYERVDGEFEYNGTMYRMVKQKFYRDTVYIVCYKHDQSIAIKDALKDYVSSFSDTSADKKPEGKFASLFIKDYLHHGREILMNNISAVDVVMHTIYFDRYKPQLYFAIDQPPQLIV